MRTFLLVGAAALVAASPAPQAFDVKAFDAIPNNLPQGPHVGPGLAVEKQYIQAQAQNAAAAAATGPATAQQAKRSADADLEKRWFFRPQQKQPAPAPTSAPVSPPVITPAPPANPTSTNIAPSGCTPVDWVNTYAFTADPACPTAVELGTYCGFINPDDPCAAQPNAYAPDTTPDTAEAFKKNPVYQALATSARTPSTYDQVFSNLNGAVEGSGYLAYKELTSYDTNACGAYCDETSGCTGFNLYIERDPKWNPRQCSCNKPDSVARFKCSIWGQEVKKEAATNVGQSQDGFEVVIVASNGYNKKKYTPPTPPSCSRPQNCNKKLHNQQPFCMGQKTFPGPFDPSLCAAYAQKQNEINKKRGLMGAFLSMFGMNKGGCVQFQAAYLEKESKGFGTHCRLFTKKFTPAQANLDVSMGGASKWGCQKSFTWDVDVNASFNWGGWSYRSKREVDAAAE
ncbi:hypothetical protein ACN47E_008528 [Coniothyrium glycines]